MRPLWLPKHDGQLTQLWEAEFSDRAIAKRMGFARRTVQGRRKRLALKPHWNPVGAGSKAPPKSIAIRRAAVQHFHRGPHVAAFPASLNIPLMEITDKQCKWAPGEPRDGFCGHRNWGKTPYCRHHARLAYTPERLRRLGL